MDPFDYGTLHESFLRTVARWGDCPAYAVPPMATRGYHPDGKQYTWRETAAAVAALRGRYAAAGYGLGHRIAILFAQRPEFFFHYYALNALGCSVVPINPDYRHDEIAYLMAHSEASLALAIESRLEDLRQVARTLGEPFAVDSFDDQAAPLPEARSPAAEGAPDGATEAALLYTSGTTGRPKGCILTNEYFHTFGSWYLSRGGRLAIRDGEERMYNPLPLHHANCLSISAPAMLLSGGCLVFPDRFHASTWWRDLVACDVTAVHMQGIIPNILLKLPRCQEERAHRVRFGLCAGIEPSQHAPFEQRFGFPSVEMWAMSETGRFMTDNVEPRRIDTRAFGRAVPGLEARIVGDDDRELPPGQPGELVIRHSAAAPRKGLFSGYLKNEAATEEAWRGGWFHTGDTAVRDDDGMFYFLDRKKNIIRRAGENIAAAEVEACLTTHDKVRQVAVIAVPDEVREEEIMACVVARAPEDAGERLARELTAWCLERLAYFKAPAWYLFVDALPTGTSQKVQKISLFPDGVDPRKQAGAIDLRTLKRPPAINASGSGNRS
jgi:acyl-CoA synthetase (AMP-forming)/AMP-acid ligase II